MCLKLSDISYCGFLGCVPTSSQECSASHLNNCPVPQLRTSMLLVCSLVSGSRVIPRSVARPLNPAAPKLHVTCWPGRKKQERCSKHKHRGLGRANQGSLLRLDGRPLGPTFSQSGPDLDPCDFKKLSEPRSARKSQWLTDLAVAGGPSVHGL